MGHKTIRATYALDNETDQRIKRLARQWDVSQAGVVRRSVRAAAEHDQKVLSPRDVVEHYAHGTMPRSKARAREAIRSLRACRHEDDKRRAGSRER